MVQYGGALDVKNRRMVTTPKLIRRVAPDRLIVLAQSVVGCAVLSGISALASGERLD